MTILYGFSAGIGWLGYRRFIFMTACLALLSSDLLIPTSVAHAASTLPPSSAFRPSIPNSEGMVPAQRTGLMNLYQDAVVNDMQLAAARHDYQAQQEAVPQARAGLLPQLHTAVHYKSEQDNNHWYERQRPRGAPEFKAHLSQPLYRPQAWYQLKAAQASVAQAALELSWKEQNLAMSVAQAYFETLRALDMLAAAEAETKALKAVWHQEKARLARGASAMTDVLEAQAAYDTANANRKQATSKVGDAFEVLYRLSGKQYTALEGLRHDLPLQRPVPDNVEAWVDDALQHNLQLTASHYHVTAANWTLKQRRAGFAPTVDVVMAYRQFDTPQKSIGLELNIPLYSGGMTRSEVRQALANIARARNEQEDRRREVAQNTRTLYRAVNAHLELITARRQAVHSSAASVRANQVGRALGARHASDLLNVERQLYSAVRQYNHARYDYVMDVLKLKLVAGHLGPADLKNLAQYFIGDYDPQRDFLPPGVRR